MPEKGSVLTFLPLPPSFPPSPFPFHNPLPFPHLPSRAELKFTEKDHGEQGTQETDSELHKEEQKSQRIGKGQATSGGDGAWRATKRKGFAVRKCHLSLAMSEAWRYQRDTDYRPPTINPVAGPRDLLAEWAPVWERAGQSIPKSPASAPIAHLLPYLLFVRTSYLGRSLSSNPNLLCKSSTYLLKHYLNAP